MLELIRYWKLNFPTTNRFWFPSLLSTEWKSRPWAASHACREDFQTISSDNWLTISGRSHSLSHNQRKSMWPRCAFFVCGAALRRVGGEDVAVVRGPEINALAFNALNCMCREEVLQIADLVRWPVSGEHLFIPLRPIDLFIPSHALLLLTEIYIHANILSRSHSLAR